MTPNEALRALKEVASRLGVGVETAVFDRHVLAGKGGLCQVRGKHKIVMDAALSVVDQANILARSLSRFDLETVHMIPSLRAYVLSFAQRNRRKRPPWSQAAGPALARARLRPRVVRDD